ncbi:MAG: hypothetical protein GWN84_13575 [Gammaproteobacteria bacterium]|nr:hypothetical protein [Gammaproteobacteria bacterium]
MALIADNQIHHLYGDPVWLRSGLTDRYVSVAIRPVQLDYYAPAILQWVTENVGDRRPLVHMGDALNAGCVWEWETFLGIMNQTDRGWVMAPGNHDAYYFGNGHFALDEWLRVCDVGDGEDGRMTKDRFIEHYLRALAAQGAVTLPATLEAEGVQRVSRSDTDATPRPNRIDVEEVAWRIDRRRPWRSFIAQRLNISLPSSPERVVVVLLDTSQYALRPRLVPWWLGVRNAGLNGQLLDDQIDVVDAWLRRGQVNVLMGHHPYRAITSQGKKAIERWRRDPGVILYVSAHKHTAQWFVHEGERANWLELNVGSTTDWTPEFRTLYVERPEAANKVGLRTQRQPVVDLWEAQCEPEWEVDPDSPYYYIRYRDLTTPDPMRTQIALMNTLLATHSWVLRKIPSSAGNTHWPSATSSDAEVLAKIQRAIGGTGSLDAKIALARELRDFEAARDVESPDDQKQFRLCQAMWSSKYDMDGARAPGVNDSYLMVPKE